MERHGLGDREAFEAIRRAARDSRRPLIDVVDETLAAGDDLTRTRRMAGRAAG